MDALPELDGAPTTAHRRAVLAERLLLDLGEVTSRREAASLVAQALCAIGGADGVRITLHDPMVPDGPVQVLASSGMLDEDDATTVSDRDSGLEMTLSAPEVPPVSVARSLRALAAVLERIAHQERLLTEARTDPLTGLLNRRALDERLEAELARQARAGGSVSLLLLDIDHFKQVNDRHGHAHGDVVLRGVADAMREVARTGDVAGRIGGDEFALLVVDAGAEGASVAAERLVQSMRQMGVTVSVGAATADGEEARTVQSLLQAADQALYAAKHAGRDRVASVRGGAGI